MPMEFSNWLNEGRKAKKIVAPSGWRQVDKKLVKKYPFTNWLKAIRFVGNVGKIAERLDHNPDIMIAFSKLEPPTYTVTIMCWTHRANRITDDDVELASEINGIPHH